MVIDSGLFVGTLRHRRFTPVAHAFTYPLLMTLLDVDRMAQLMRRSRLTSHNRWNWASFHDRDHFGDPSRPLRERLVAHMETSQAGSVGFDATLSLERRPWNAAEVRRVLVRYPAMTTSVIAEIHWETLKLWWKGAPVVSRIAADGAGEQTAAMVADSRME